MNLPLPTFSTTLIQPSCFPHSRGVPVKMEQKKDMFILAASKIHRCRISAKNADIFEVLINQPSFKGLRCLLIPLLLLGLVHVHGVKKMAASHKFESNLAQTHYFDSKVGQGHFFDTICTLLEPCFGLQAGTPEFATIEGLNLLNRHIVRRAGT